MHTCSAICRVLSRCGHCFLLRHIASFYRSEAITQGMLLLSSDKISINCACATAVSKLRRWYGKKRDAIYSCTMINTVKSVMLTCKKLSARYTVPFNTVFRLKRKFAFHTYVSKTTRLLVYQYLHMTCFCYENAFSLCINIGMSHVCVTKTLHCLNQRIKIPSETMRACYENLFSLCINIIISHICVTKTPHCWWERIKMPNEEQ